MRDFFINSFEKLVNVLVVLMCLGVLIAAVVVLISPNGGNGAGGLLAALGVLLFGGVYVILVGGVMYLGLGIYQNTKRAADLLEAQRR